VTVAGQRGGAPTAAYRIASNRARMAALPSSITAAGSRPSCLYRPGDKAALWARMIAARCAPRRANFDAMLKARGLSWAAMAACTWASLVCNPGLLWPSALYGARANIEEEGETLAGWSRMGRVG
jgi:hypothetical protein